MAKLLEGISRGLRVMQNIRWRRKCFMPTHCGVVYVNEMQMIRKAIAIPISQPLLD